MAQLAPVFFLDKVPFDLNGPAVMGKRFGKLASIRRHARFVMTPMKACGGAAEQNAFARKTTSGSAGRYVQIRT